MYLSVEYLTKNKKSKKECAIAKKNDLSNINVLL